jgi:hypothetical protein
VREADRQSLWISPKACRVLAVGEVVQNGAVRKGVLPQGWSSDSNHCRQWDLRHRAQGGVWFALDLTGLKQGDPAGAGPGWSCAAQGARQSELLPESRRLPGHQSRPSRMKGRPGLLGKARRKSLHPSGGEGNAKRERYVLRIASQAGFNSGPGGLVTATEPARVQADHGFRKGPADRGGRRCRRNPELTSHPCGHRRHHLPCSHRRRRLYGRRRRRRPYNHRRHRPCTRRRRRRL